MIKIVLVDESPVFRMGLKQCLRDSELSIVGEASSGLLGKQMLREQRPDVIFVDINLPDMSGALLHQSIDQYSPRTKMILLLRDDNLSALSRLIADNVAEGFILKKRHDLFEEAIKTVHAGDSYLQPNLGLLLVHYQREYLATLIHSLTAREYQVLLMIACGQAYQNIAAAVKITLKTVYNLKSQGFKKLDIQTVDQLRLLILNSKEI